VRIMIAGGGTGGHIFPGVAIADAIERQSPGAEVFFMGRRASIEERVVTATGRSFVRIPSMGVRRGRDFRNAAVPFVVGVGYVRSLAALATRRPAVAVGTGGFTSVPPLLAAKTLGIPLVLQEQNAHPGLATRVLSRFAESVHVSFDDTKDHLPRAREVILSGNPVRQAFRDGGRACARRALGLPEAGTVVFFLGGSRGARTINEALVAAGPRLAEVELAVIAQTGPDDVDLVRNALNGAGVRAVVAPFFDNVAQAYAASDLLVSRAGATVIAEITVAGDGERRGGGRRPRPRAHGHRARRHTGRASERSGAVGRNG
jgi:UDP-N-acetylglucosamine--N-acetylmuramyl-(pentapeptide) pyrophosphoryl-undecaprenol N-acetylglucosamine transferase